MPHGPHLCPWWLTYTFDNPLRRWVHDPDQVLEGLVKPGNRVADLGCGFGHFTVGLARRVGPDGLVVAVDLQPRQLQHTRDRVRAAGLEARVETRLATPASLGLEPGAFDLIVAFWMVHEVEGLDGFLRQVIEALRPGAACLVAEPAIHVSARGFAEECEAATRAGFGVEPRRVRFSHAAVWRRAL